MVEKDIHPPAKSGNDENSIENDTKGWRTAAPALSGTSLSTAIGETPRSTKAATTVVAPSNKKINMITLQETILNLFKTFGILL